jgi:hypothetical protein
VLAAVIAVAAVAWGDHDGGSAELCSSPEILEVRVGDTSASDASDLPFAVGLTGTFDEQTKGPRHRLQLCEKKSSLLRCSVYRCAPSTLYSAPSIRVQLSNGFARAFPPTVMPHDIPCFPKSATRLAEGTRMPDAQWIN